MALSNRPALRWAVPTAVVAIVLGAAAITSVTATAAPTLPPRSAADLLVDVQTASIPGLSGTVVQDAQLGLPDLPIQLGGRGSSDFSSLVSGTHTLRVWYAGAGQQRLALLGTLGESDLVRNGTDVWTWSSESNEATHYQLPEQSDSAEAPDPTVPAMTPQQAAEAALAAIDPTTSVTTDGTAEVAGRAAYELVLAPKDSASLVGQVRIAIDAEQHIPLRVQVFAKDAPEPAFEVGFSQISFDVPGAEQFQFTPPPGATVTDSTLGQQGKMTPSDKPQVTPGPDPSAAAERTVVGTGWTTVIVATLPTDGAPAPISPDEATPSDAAPVPGGPNDGRPERPSGSSLGSIVGSLPAVSGDWGSGRLLESALFSVLITDDGRVIAGAVGPDLLYQAAAQ